MKNKLTWSSFRPDRRKLRDRAQTVANSTTTNGIFIWMVSSTDYYVSLSYKKIKELHQIIWSLPNNSSDHR